MTNTADLEQLCARLEDEREELKDRSRITGEFSALDPMTAQRIANTMYDAQEALASLSRMLEEVKQHARTSLGKWEHARFCRSAAREHLPGAEKVSLLDGARVAEAGIISDMTHIWRLLIPDEADLSTADVAREPADKGSEGL